MNTQDYIDASRNGIEIWKDIPGYEGKYQASTLGRVKRLKQISFSEARSCYCTYDEKMLIGYIRPDGYTIVGIKGKYLFKSVWVAMTFLNHKPNGHTIIVDHINRDILDDKLCNLQLITQANNGRRHSWGRSKHIGVYWHKAAQKWCATINNNGKRKYIGLFENEDDAANAYQAELNML